MYLKLYKTNFLSLIVVSKTKMFHNSFVKRINFWSVTGSLLTICFFITIFSFEDCDFCFSPPALMIKFFLCGLVILVGSLYFTRQFIKAEKLIFTIENQPILELHEATDGVPFSGYGKIEPIEGKILKAPFSKTECVYYHSIKEVRRQTGGNNRWRIVANLVNFVPFYLSDGQHKLKVDLTNLDYDFSGYKISLPRLIPNPRHSEIDCLLVVNNKDSNIRTKEYVLIPGVKVFAYGMVSSRGENELVLHEDQRHPLILSAKTQERFVEEFYKGNSLVYLVHFFVSAGFTIIVLSLNYFIHLNQWIFAILLIGNSLIVFSIIFSIFNRLITLRERAISTASNIEIELKRRAELIPAIIQIVKDYVQHESEIHKIISEARTHLGELASLAAVIEKYPNLEAVENFQLLLQSLVDTEERLVYAREFYNRTVRKFNIMIFQFPFSLVAFLANFKPMNFWSFNQLQENK